MCSKRYIVCVESAKNGELLLPAPKFSSHYDRQAQPTLKEKTESLDRPLGGSPVSCGNEDGRKQVALLPWHGAMDKVRPMLGIKKGGKVGS